MKVCCDNLFPSTFLVIGAILCVHSTGNKLAWNYADEMDSWFYYGSSYVTLPKRIGRTIPAPSEHESTTIWARNMVRSNADRLLLSDNNDIEPIEWNPAMCSNKSGRPPSSFLWRISTEPPSYLFGTLHVAYIHIWPRVAPIVKEVFRNADQVYFELDLTNPNTLEELRKCQMLPDNTHLTDLLPSELVTRLQTYLARFQQSLDCWSHPERLGYMRVLYETITKDWQRKRPIWILLLVNSLNRGELSDRGVPVLDLYLAQEASRLGKIRGAVELVEDQCRPLNEVKNDQVAMALEMTLDSLESMTNSLPDCQRETVRPLRPLTSLPPPQLQSQPLRPAPSAPSVSDRANLVTHAGSNNIPVEGSSQHHSPSTGGRTNIQTKSPRHSEWFMHPVHQLVQQYNCGDLTPVLQGAPMSQAASMTASKSVVDKRTSQPQRSERTTDVGVKHWSDTLVNGQTQTRRSNDSDAMDSAVLMLELEGYLNRELIVKRNARMAKHIVDTLKTVQKRNECALFALGAAHFLGESGTIIDHLEQAGYQVTAVPRNLTYAELVPNAGAEIKRQQHNAKYISRNRRKQNEDKELLSEVDVPEFRPRYVKFENHWIRIEDFKPNTYPNRLQRPSAQVPISRLPDRVEKFNAQPKHGSENQQTLTPRLLQNVSKGVAMTIRTPYILSTLIYSLSVIHACSVFHSF